MNLNHQLAEFLNEYSKKQSQYETKVFNALTNIIMGEEGISEKSFASVSDANDLSERTIHNANEIVQNSKGEHRRPQLCAELIYEEFLQKGDKDFKSFAQIEKEANIQGHKHHLRLICVSCGKTQICRCSSPKTIQLGICYECEGIR